jgi:hypothetical protein
MHTLVASFLCALAIGLAVGCNSSGRVENAERGDPLARAIHLPTLATEKCPTESGRIVDQAFGLAFGRGPVYAAALGKNGTLQFSPPERFDSERWGGNKVLWLVGPESRGPLLIRGRRLDKPALVRFDEGNVPPGSIRLGAVGAGLEPAWRNRPSYTRVQGLGCYAWQIDGRGFSYAIVFRVVAARD